MANKITLSVIKADVGGFVGHSNIHETLLEEATERMEAARLHGPIIDFHVNGHAPEPLAGVGVKVEG